MKSKFIKVNGLNLHLLDNECNGKPKIFLLHGLSSNSHIFDGLINAGLDKNYHIIIPDLRGRGLSDKPFYGYSLEHHIRDIIELIKYYNDDVYLVGHSFGGFLSYYISAYYPDKVKKVICIDSAAEMNSNISTMLFPGLMRLTKIYNNFDEYIFEMKKMPYNDFWDEIMLSYYQADVKKTYSGHIISRSSIFNIIESSIGVMHQDWYTHISKIEQPLLLLNGLDNYCLGQAILTKEKALKTINIIKNSEYSIIEGNHHTMLYGVGALQIVNKINGFL